MRKSCIGVVVLALLPVCWPQQRELDSKSYYDRWLNEDVLYIITDEERAVFSKLTTNEEREQFVEQFWLRRDPDPETPENEYKVEHYRRIMYANEKFTAGIPGWRTDRGRIYIMFGAPDRYETNPTGGSYERPMEEGGGHTSVAPFEKWEYRHIEGVGDDIELEFVDDKGGGLYQLTFDPQRKDDLLQLGFMGPTLDEIENYETKGIKNKQDRIAGRNYANGSPAYKTMNGYQMAKDSFFARLDLSGKLNRAPVIKYKDLEAVVTARVTYTAVPVQYNAGFVRISQRQVLVPVTLEIPNSALTYKHQLGIYTGKLLIYGQVTSLSLRREAVFEEEVAREFTDDTYQSGMSGSSLFQKQLVLPPGIYKLEIVVKDSDSGHMSTIEQRLQVPEFADEKLSLSSVVLATSIEKAPMSTDVRFQYGSLKVMPRVNAAFRNDEEMGFYFQVYGLQNDASTSKPKAKVEFAVVPKGQQPGYWRDASSLLMPYATHATVARIGSLSVFKPGDYELMIRVTDLVSGQQVQSVNPFSILPALAAKSD